MIDKRILAEEPKAIKNIRKIRKIVNVIICIIVIPIIIINLAMLIKSIMNPKEVPSVLQCKFFVVLTGSMEDTLKPGDFIVSRVTDTESLKVGDIISFKNGENVITHRIIEIKTNKDRKTFVTKGDNNNSQDSKEVEPEEIQGKYIFKIPVIGKFLTFLQTTPGIAILIAIPIIFNFTSSRLEQMSNKKKMIRKSKRIEYERKKKE